MAIREFDLVVNGQRVGWWREFDPDVDQQPFTWRPQPTPTNPHPPTFTSNFTPYNLFAIPMRTTWNGVYLQLNHHQFPGNLPTLYFHRQLATDHAKVLGVLYQPYGAVQQQLQRRSADMLFSLSRSRERLAMHMLRVLLEVYHRRCSQIDI